MREDLRYFTDQVITVCAAKFMDACVVPSLGFVVGDIFSDLYWLHFGIEVRVEEEWK